MADPQATFSTPASIASANESDADVLAGQTNYVYLRVWNRGEAAAQNVFANVYYSPPATSGDALHVDADRLQLLRRGPHGQSGDDQ